jgi:hypothetical protein
VVETHFAYRKLSGDISVTIQPAKYDNLKNIPVIDSIDFFSLSRYVGDVRPQALEIELNEYEELKTLQNKIGFTDMLAYANLRRKDGKIIIIDTEYGSFSNSSFLPYFDEEADLEFTFSRAELGMPE